MQITTLLTLSTLFGSLPSIVPAVSYLTKMDIYLVICMTHVFFALIEFPIVLTIQKYGYFDWVIRIEMLAKITLLGSFIIFNVIYWIQILNL